MISVTERPPLSPPAMLTGNSGFRINPATGHATLKFTAQDGVQYQLEYKDDLLSADPWQPCSAPVVTNGSPQITLQDTNSLFGAAQRFYRIQAQWPN